MKVAKRNDKQTYHLLCCNFAGAFEDAEHGEPKAQNPYGNQDRDEEEPVHRFRIPLIPVFSNVELGRVLRYAKLESLLQPNDERIEDRDEELPNDEFWQEDEKVVKDIVDELHWDETAWKLKKRERNFNVRCLCVT